MSKTKNKKATRRDGDGAARKSSPAQHRRKLKIGDRVRIIDIPENLRDENYDLQDADHREMRTAELFRFCVGRVFTVYGFGRHGHAELHVSNSSAVRHRFGRCDIWCEPEILERVERKNRRSE